MKSTTDLCVHTVQVKTSTHVRVCCTIMYLSHQTRKQAVSFQSILRCLPQVGLIKSAAVSHRQIELLASIDRAVVSKAVSFPTSCNVKMCPYM